jgi:SAM-dependent methyltransferase
MPKVPEGEPAAVPAPADREDAAGAGGTAVRVAFDGKARDWGRKGALVQVEGNDSPLDDLLPTFLPPMATVVDLGGGSGRMLIKVAGICTGGTLMLVDLSRRMAEVAHAELLRLGQLTKVVVVVGDARRVPLPPDGADIVVIRQLLQHVLVEPNAVIREAARMLRPGGVVLVQVPGPRYLAAWFRFAGHDTDALGRFSIEELEGLFLQAGLRPAVLTFPFTFRFDNAWKMMRFFERISLVDKLSDYEPVTSEGLDRVLSHPLVSIPLARTPGIDVAGEYLVGIARKEASWAS